MWFLRLATTLAALVLLPIPAAVAEPTWSAPSTIAAGFPALSEPTIGFGAAVSRCSPPACRPRPTASPATASRACSASSPTAASPAARVLVLAAPPAPYGANRLALLRVPLTEGDRTIGDFEHPRVEPRLQLRAQRRAAQGIGPEHTGGSPRRPTSSAARSGADARGDVLAAWVEHLGGRDHLVAAVRRAGSVFGRPAVIGGTGTFSAVSVAVSPQGDLLVAYQRSSRSSARGPIVRRVEARVRRPCRLQLGRAAAAGRVERLQRDRDGRRRGRPDGRRVGHAGRRRGGRHAVDRARRRARRAGRMRSTPSRSSSAARASSAQRARSPRRWRPTARRRSRGRGSPARRSRTSIRRGSRRRRPARRASARRRRCRRARRSATWRSTPAAPRSSSRRRCRPRATTRRPSRSSPACGPRAQPGFGIPELISAPERGTSCRAGGVQPGHAPARGRVGQRPAERDAPAALRRADGVARELAANRTPGGATCHGQVRPRGTSGAPPRAGIVIGMSIIEVHDCASATAR